LRKFGITPTKPKTAVLNADGAWRRARGAIMEEDNNIETYLDGGNHQGEIVDGLVTYSSNDCSFRLKDESWQAYESKILKPTDLTILTNETPFTNSQLAKALVEIWFADENEDRKEIANRKARDRRAKQKEVV
jgi:hypothetical protein